MWAAIADAYGSAFTSQFGDEPNQTWADGLSTFTVEQVVEAVGRIITGGGSYAPNLGTVMKELQVSKAPNQHLMSRSVDEALNAPVVDRSEKPLELPAPDENVPDFGDFKSMWDDA